MSSWHFDADQWIKLFLPKYEDWSSVRTDDPRSHAYACGWFDAVRGRAKDLNAAERKAYLMGYDDAVGEGILHDPR